MPRNPVMVAHTLSKVNFAASQENLVPFDNGITQLFHYFSCASSSHDPLGKPEK